MDPVASNIASSVAGVHQSERRASKETERAGRQRELARPKRSAEDEVEVQHTESADAPHTAKGNDEEETHEDRQKHGHYDAHGTLHPDGHGDLDLSV